MATQDEIDAIDETKPSGSGVPRTGPIRQNFAHIKTALQDLLDDMSGLSGSSLSSLILTGVSFVTATAIVATDNALAALGKLQAQIDLKQNALGYTPENTANKGVANGYVPLNSSIKIDTDYLPDAILGALKYQAAWNANTNTPVLPSASTANKGYYWIVSVAGATAISGIADWQVGDWVISNGVSYNKIDNTDAISLFNGRTGNITLLDTDVLPLIPDATTSTKGIILLADNSTTITGSNTTKAVTPASLAAKLALSDLNTPITKTASHTIASTDLDTLENGNPIILMSVSGANNITIPSDATLGLSTTYGQRFNFAWEGIGQPTVVGSGSTVIGTPGLKLRARYSFATAWRISANTWRVFGDLSA